MNEQDFWQDKKRSEETLKEVRSIKSKLEPIESLSRQLKDNGDILELAREEKDDALVDDVDRDLGTLEEELEELEVVTLFSGPDDARNVILAIHPGAGGTESADWAEMLLRMYTRFAEKKGVAASRARRWRSRERTPTGS